jgi:hypothetical protein
VTIIGPCFEDAAVFMVSISEACDLSMYHPCANAASWLKHQSGFCWARKKWTKRCGMSTKSARAMSPQGQFEAKNKVRVEPNIRRRIQ